MEDVFELLTEKGAGLVTGFCVDDTFRDMTIMSHTGTVMVPMAGVKKLSRHAMILVGVREDIFCLVAAAKLVER
jgi:hypothetical protein